MSLITITRGIGTGGAAVARQVAEALDIPLYDDDRLQQEALLRLRGVLPDTSGCWSHGREVAAMSPSP